MHESWKPHLEPLREVAFDATLRVNAEIAAGKRIFPAMNQRFAAFTTPFDELKVVIIGQDPYHGPNQANGLAFSVHKGIAIPPSLRNIYKELQNDLGYTPAPHGDLMCWAKQGVLLLNSTLTVEQGAPASHKDYGWDKFVYGVLAQIVKQKKNTVFILWGSHAQKLVQGLDLSNCHVISSVHPSPLSAERGFFGSKPFSRTNLYLESKSISPVNWGVV